MGFLSLPSHLVCCKWYGRVTWEYLVWGALRAKQLDCDGSTLRSWFEIKRLWERLGLRLRGQSSEKHLQRQILPRIWTVSRVFKQDNLAFNWLRYLWTRFRRGSMHASIKLQNIFLEESNWRRLHTSIRESSWRTLATNKCSRDFGKVSYSTCSVVGLSHNQSYRQLISEQEKWLIPRRRTRHGKGESMTLSILFTDPISWLGSQSRQSCALRLWWFSFYFTKPTTTSKTFEKIPRSSKYTHMD